jgi:hypothetical protein
VVVQEAEQARAILAGAGMEVRQDGGALIVDEQDGSRVVRLLAEASIYPSQVGPARSSLETVFLGMTGEERS